MNLDDAHLVAETLGTRLVPSPAKFSILTPPAGL